MTQSYSQLQKQIETLRRQADKVRENEVKGVVDRIKVAIAQYGITASQLGFRQSSGAGRSSRSPGAALSQSAKYADGSGNVWAGRGPRPHWLRDALLAGKKLEDFAVESASAAVASGKTGAKAKSKGKRKAKAQYRDPATGNKWGGFGPKPRWLREAIESGKPLEQFAA